MAPSNITTKEIGNDCPDISYEVTEVVFPWGEIIKTPVDIGQAYLRYEIWQAFI